MIRAAFCSILLFLLAVASAEPACTAEESAEKPAVVKIKPKTIEEAGKFSEVKPSAKSLRDRYHGITNPPASLDNVVQVGEKLEYQVRWQGIPAGTITLRAKRIKRINDRKAMTLEMHVASNDFLSFVYPVDSTITSLADTENGTSYLFRRRLAEGRRRVNDRLQFDYDYKWADGRVEAAAVYSKVDDGETKTKDPREIPGPLQDALSVVYYMRHLEFAEKGDSHQILLGSRKRVDIVTITAKEFAKRKLAGLGEYDCVVIEPKGDEDADRSNIVSTKGKADIWLEKSTGIPLFLSVDVPFGTATATLISTENTDLEKHRLD